MEIIIGLAFFREALEKLKEGAVDFLHKPLTAAVVELKIKELLAQASKS